MAVTNFTPLLGLALPTTGDLQGTWGATVNTAITDLLDDAVAGTVTLTTDANTTLTTTNGADNQARNAVILCTGARTAIRTITAPAQSKLYVIINATTGGFGVKIVGAGPTTGITVLAGTQVMVVWNGTDFVVTATGDLVGPASSTDNAITRFDLTTGKLVQNSLVTVADDGAITAPQVGSIIPFYYANQAAFPSAATYHGALAHSHADGAMFFAHGSVWNRLLDDVTDVTVAQGGTGLSTLTANNVILGNGTSAPLFVAPSTSGNVLTSNGTTWQSSTPAAGSSGANPTATVSGSVVNGSAVTFMRSDAAPALANTAVTAASYTNASITVDAQGRITAASSGAGASAATPTALGTVYGNTTTTSNSLTALGYTAGSNNTGSNTVAIGFQALSATSSAVYNTAVGYQSLQATTSGDFNTAVGTLALKGNTTGTSNVAFGQQALLTNTVGAYNTALGSGALLSSNSDNNTVVGGFAGVVISSGANNTLLGFQAGYSGSNNLTTGIGNILIGYNTAATSAATNYEITLGDGNINKFRIPGLSISWEFETLPFRNIPQNAQTGSYTLVLGDSGKHIFHASGAGAATYTIPANSSVAYAIGTAITFINLSATSISIAITTDTMYLSSAGTTGTRTLAQYGSATAIKVTSTSWLISGSALT